MLERAEKNVSILLTFIALSEALCPSCWPAPLVALSESVLLELLDRACYAHGELRLLDQLAHTFLSVRCYLQLRINSGVGVPASLAPPAGGSQLIHPPAYSIREADPNDSVPTIRGVA